MCKSKCNTSKCHASCDDLTGLKIGRIHIVGICGKDKHRNLLWDCLFDTGEHKSLSRSEINKQAFTKGNIKRPPLIEGQKFGKLTVLENLGADKNRQYLFRCKCECGNEKIVKYRYLAHNVVVSCGCTPQNRKGMYKSNLRLHDIYSGMRQRCLDSKNKEYHNYGGKGISICEEWSTYKAFEYWALHNGYKEGLSIDRINGNGNYEPSNCRWATPSEQMHNVSYNVWLTFKGQKLILADWVRKGFINPHFYYRHKDKYETIEELFEQYEKRKRNKKV